jgi:hypothetical protein
MSKNCTDPNAPRIDRYALEKVMAEELLEVKLIVDCPKQSTPMTSRSLSFRGGI